MFALFAVALAVASWRLGVFVLHVIRATRAERSERLAVPVTFRHPQLGVLRSEYRGHWEAVLDSVLGPLTVAVDGTELTPDDAQAAVVVRLLSGFGSIVERARSFLRAREPDAPTSLMPSSLICHGASPCAYVVEFVSERDDLDGVWGVSFEADEARDCYRDD